MDVYLKNWHSWQHHTIVDASSLEEAAYKAVRATHDFLTDANHTFQVGEKTIMWGGKESKFKSVVIFRGQGVPPCSGPLWAESEYWFVVEYAGELDFHNVGGATW